MYYLTLGHSPALAQLELEALNLSPRPIGSQFAALSNPELPEVVKQTGGVTRAIEFIRSTAPHEAISGLRSLIETSPAKSFAISNYSRQPLTSADLSNLKNSVNRSRGTRFLSFESSGHSLVALRKQHIAEYSLLEDDGQLVLGQTVWIQDADDWSFRDRRRPYQDIKRGMLPPKIARVIVNLAGQGKEGVLLDPFCGTGTVLMEAMLSGLSVVGSDNDTSAITGSERNLSWLIEKYQLKNKKYKLLQSDATHISKHFSDITCIATEPYLGPLLELSHLPSPDRIKNIAKGLDKLYRGSLNDWHKFLPQGGRVVMVIPEFHAYDRRFSTLEIDSIRRLGYNIESQTPYSQPNAVVVRLITVLTKE